MSSINNLKATSKRSYDSDENIKKKIKIDTNCGICFEDIKLKKKSILPCGHFYCLSCITKYTEKSKSRLYKCPTCRCEFSKINITYSNDVSNISFKSYRNVKIVKLKKNKIEDIDDSDSGSDSDTDIISKINNKKDNNKLTINPTKIKINSFTNSNQYYTCDIVKNTCTCPHFIMRNVICKHLNKCHDNYGHLLN